MSLLDTIERQKAAQRFSELVATLTQQTISIENTVAEMEALKVSMAAGKAFSADELKEVTDKIKEAKSLIGA